MSRDDATVIVKIAKCPSVPHEYYVAQVHAVNNLYANPRVIDIVMAVAQQCYFIEDAQDIADALENKNSTEHGVLLLDFTDKYRGNNGSIPSLQHGQLSCMYQSEDLAESQQSCL